MINNMQNDHYKFYKENKNDKMWWVERFIILDKDKEISNDNVDIVMVELLVSFDKKIYNLWQDYPHNFTK